MGLQISGGSGAPADGSITSAKIEDGAIVNADVNASAAIASSKLSGFPGVPNVGKFKSGRYYGCAAGQWTTAAMTLNVNFYVPVWIGEAITLDRIGIRVGTAGGAGSVVRLGIYSDDGDGYPGAKLLDAGTIDSTGTGNPAITISQALPTGLYWFTACAQVGTVPNVGFTQGTSAVNLGVTTVANATGGSINGYSETGITGALPTNASTSMDGNYANAAGFFRVA